MPIACGAINVKDSPYNAYGDGTHDDAGAIQSAIDATGISFAGTYLRKQVCIPAGRYRCDSGLSIPYGCSVVGHPGGTVLDFANAGSSVVAIQWGTSALDASQGGLSGLTIYGPGASSSSTGIMVGDASSSGTKKLACDAMRDCVIRDFATGINLGSNCFINQFEHLRIAYNNRGVDASGAHSEFGENLLFDFCSFDENAAFHFRIHSASGGQGVTFRNCTFVSANDDPEAEIGAGTTILFDKCVWDSDLAGSSGSPLLIDIAYPIGTIVLRDMLFRLNSPSGIPICWNSGASNACRITFDSCRVTGAGSSLFYSATSSFGGQQPVALAIQSPDVTAASGKITRIDP